MTLGPVAEEPLPPHVCAPVYRAGWGQPVPVRGHLQAEGHLEMGQLLPTFQDLGNLTLEALLLLLQGPHGQLQSKPEAVSEGGGPAC